MLNNKANKLIEKVLICQKLIRGFLVRKHFHNLFVQKSQTESKRLLIDQIYPRNTKSVLTMSHLNKNKVNLYFSFSLNFKLNIVLKGERTQLPHGWNVRQSD